MVIVREYRESDARQLAELYFDSVRHGTRQHYSREQREAWAPSVPDPETMRPRLEAMTVFVAEDDNDVVGFMTLDETGYIDLAFVRSDRIGSGIGSRLYESIEHASRDMELERLFTHASELAKPLFEKYGWVVCAQQQVERDGVMLTNYRMEKLLTG